jgi:molybdopterin-synthase adenylyltransferase
MLSDSQIERYCRQIILPGFGSAAQEALLGSSIFLAGDGDALVLCASYLAGAGIGRLAIDCAVRAGSSGAVLGLMETDHRAVADLVARRNPDCRLLDEIDDPSMSVVLADARPARLPSTAPVIWGSVDSRRVRLARFAAGRVCLECVAAAAERFDAAGAVALGTLAALEALRMLLGLAREDPPTLTTIDLAEATTSHEILPARACGHSHSG